MSEDTKIPTDIDMFVGRRVRARRLELNLSQQALAEQAGVTFQQLQKYENGANRISAGRLYDLARALRATIQYFYEGVDALRTGRRIVWDSARERVVDDAAADRLVGVKYRRPWKLPYYARG